MISPNFLNFIFFWNRAWVPKIILILLFSKFFKISFLSLYSVFPVNKFAFALSLNTFLKKLKCCFANISVGAINATWYWFKITFWAAINATIVFPEPTSPWRSLNILSLDEISLLISFIALFWSIVNLNPICFSTEFDNVNFIFFGNFFFSFEFFFDIWIN